MSALVYLVLTQIKNSLKELRHKPAKLFLYLLLVGLVVFTLVAGQMRDPLVHETQPMFYLTALYFAFLLLFFGQNVQKGLTSGGNIFEMSDVNLLFVAPVNPRSILLYGLVRLAKFSFLAGFFILFQGSSLANFGVDAGGVLLIFATFTLCMAVLSILSLVIYSVSNGNERRKAVVKLLLVLLFAPALLYAVWQYIQLGDPAQVLEKLVESPLFSGIPFVGWTTAGTVALLSGQLGTGLCWLSGLLLSGIIMVVYIMYSRSDYYEDVLVASQTAFERKLAAAQGDIQGASVTPAGKVSLRRTGLGGFGPSVLLFKHLREDFRQNRAGFFSIGSLIIFGALLVGSLMAKEQLNLFLILQILMWIQIFMIGNGRGLRELYTHYIYLIPAPAFGKILWSNLELVIKTLIESVFFFVIPGLILNSQIPLIVSAALVYTAFTLLLIAVNYFSMRWTGANLSTGMLLMLYFLLVLLVMLPGILAAVAVGMMIGGTFGLTLGLASLAAWEVLVSCVCFFLSKGVLHNCDMPSVKPIEK